jgi:hypothetical protein
LANARGSGEGQPIKVCACGRSYTRAEWNALPDRIVYTACDEVHEQRRCLCGSHIVVVLEAAQLGA